MTTSHLKRLKCPKNKAVADIGYSKLQNQENSLEIQKLVQEIRKKLLICWMSQVKLTTSIGGL